METKKPRAPRRTQAQLEEDIMNALEELVIKNGFSKILLTDLINQSGIEATVFYRRYGTIDNILAILSKRYDFWINDAIDIKQLNVLGPRDFYASVLKLLYKELKGNLTMQKLLVWELNEDNEETRRTSNIRETMNMSLISYYDQLFQHTNVDIKCATAILISGIYYLVLHRDRSQFCTIDFNSKESDAIINRSIESITELIFRELDKVNMLRGVIERMRDGGIEDGKICEFLNISSVELKKYSKQPLLK